ncbi:unnamed protein product, partial [marine sediment metagenome]
MGKGKVLQHKDGSTLTEDKAMAVGIKGARCFLWLTISRGDSSIGSESGNAYRTDYCLAAAGEHSLGIATPYSLVSNSHSIRATGAGGAGAEVWALSPEQ